MLERQECLYGDQAVLDKVEDREGEECEKRCVYVADGDLEHRGGFDSHEADEVERRVDHDAEGDDDDRVAHQFYDRLALLAEAVVDEAEGDVLASFARRARAECNGPDESYDGILVGPFELVVEKIAGEDLQAECYEHEQECGDWYVDADCRFHDMYRRGKLLGHCDLLPLNMSFLGPIEQMDYVLVSSDMEISLLPWPCHLSDPLQVKFMFSMR